MKRDMDLVRKILMLLDEHPQRFAPSIEIEGYSQEQIGYHAYIMIQAGLVTGSDVTAHGDPGPQAIISSLTWQGHEFLDAARDPSLWRQAKEVVEKVGTAPIQVWTSVLTDLVKSSIGI